MTFNETKALAKDLGELISNASYDKMGRLEIKPILLQLTKSLDDSNIRIIQFKNHRNSIIQRLARFQNKQFEDVYLTIRGQGTWYV